MVALVIALVTALIISLLGFIVKMLMTWFLSVYSAMFYNAMAVETLFYDIIDNGSFNLTGLYQAIYTFAIALLIMFFVKKLLETYMAWSNGDPETSPMSILIGFLKAIIIMITFGFIYETFVEIFYQMFMSMMNGAFGEVQKDLDIVKDSLGSISTWLNIVGLFFYVIVGIFCTLIYFQNIGRGIEMFVLRLGMPFACIGLLNADGGAFRGYFQKMIKVGFTVVVQLLLVRFTIALLSKFHLVIALATILMAYKTPGLLNEFMATSGNGYYGARGAGSFITRTSVIRHNLTKGK